MCERGEYVDFGAFKVDRCIAPLVRALNEIGWATVASCCGHGKAAGRIILADGREIQIRAFDPEHIPGEWSMLVTADQLEALRAGRDG